jgi:hypothetical protein
VPETLGNSNSKAQLPSIDPELAIWEWNPQTAGKAYAISRREVPLEPGGLNVGAYRRESGGRQQDRPSGRKFQFLDPTEETGWSEEDDYKSRQCDKMPP